MRKHEVEFLRSFALPLLGMLTVQAWLMPAADFNAFQRFILSILIATAALFLSFIVTVNDKR